MTHAQRPAGDAQPSVVRRTVAMLATSQALAMTGMSLTVTVAALAGEHLAPDPRLATVPLALQATASTLATVPAALLMRRIGRRAGFLCGQGVGAVGAALATLALCRGSFVLLALGSALMGVHNAFWQYYRFAAAETASDAFRSRAISLVLAGGVVAALFGPELAKRGRNLIAAAPFAGSYAIVGILCLVAVVVLTRLRLAPPPPAQRRGGRSLAVIASQPRFLVAVTAAAMGYAVMVLLMAATPLAMRAHHHPFSDTAFVIQWHVLAMFAPSFFTGGLIRRFGVVPILTAGLALNLACVGINLSGQTLNQFWVALFLLGVGWNFLFIGGTTLLTETYRPEEGTKVQALNDFIVFGLVTVATFSSGVLQNTLGWRAINLAVLAPLSLCLFAVVWLQTRPRPAVDPG